MQQAEVKDEEGKVETQTDMHPNCSDMASPGIIPNSKKHRGGDASWKRQLEARETKSGSVK